MAASQKKKDRREHRTDLAGHIQVCELNYFRLMGMLPRLREGDEQWHFRAGDVSQIYTIVRLTESAPYTSVLEVEQRHDTLALASFSLRLYHDAQVAEVIAFAGHRHWQPKYDYPNPAMYQPDEKMALNRFLSDWLVFCRKHGLQHVEYCDSVLVSRKS